MANTVAVTRVDNGRNQFQGMWSDMWKVVATWSDQDAIADDVSVLVSLTAEGLSLADKSAEARFRCAEEAVNILTEKQRIQLEGLLKRMLLSLDVEQD